MRWCFIVWIFLIGRHAAAQDPAIQKLSAQITNGNSRQWTLDSTTIYLGDTCSNGVRLSFFLNPSIVHKKVCANGNWVTNIYAWQITKTGDDIVPHLTFYNKDKKVQEVYDIQFVKVNNSNFLRLRRSASQNEDTHDYYFK